MESLPWEDGDPPDSYGLRFADDVGGFVEGLSSLSVAAAGRSVQTVMVRWGGYDVMVPSCSRWTTPCQKFGAYDREPPGREADAHAVTPSSVARAGIVRGLESQEELQLNLGLTDTTKYSSYSKIWRKLYFVNDAPFCIHNLARATSELWETLPTGLSGITQ